PQVLIPGETVSTRVVLDQGVYRVPAGHQLRIAVSTAYWPMIWPSPEPVRLDVAKATLKLPPPSYARLGGEIIASELRDVGIDLEIVPVEWAQWLDQVLDR
ncbi:CocE/NonD family hydrolase C-terminal non-catalytic domain-containing protein, partial [Mesorhizobium sp. M8A.F.Ca.ET.161.01.1.1]|uniref:CocE/NonD family hydrolase C-terminal non-catalytic domain-containing protein n=1 Tax=Mesorhizobium sp. M8A.F.Ca.ET.161.01.1.1 TaxID=2563959 RepID=UPI002484C20D